MIDKATIDKIFSAADIAEVIGDYVHLKKAGQNFKGLSPFKTEKTPSFFVSPSKGIFKCFSSGIGGNVVTFLMELEKISYPEALKLLARKYNIEIVEKEETPEEKEIQNERESLLSVNQFALKYFTDTLSSEEGKAVGRSYLAERGIHDSTIRKFMLGYSREDRYAFTKKAAESGFKIDYLLKTGLVIRNENNTFDRFHGRIIFPIHGLSGQVAGFAGRIMKSSEKVAKYINSPESEIYHKSDILYGLFFARQSILKNDKCYLVEGYTDVMSMHQCGIENVVASSGTSLTVNQIRLVKRFTHNITVLYDGDEAGIKASLRGIDLLLEEGLNVRVVLLPEGEDPDSFARTGSAGSFISYIGANETDFISFKVNLLAKEAENDPIRKASLINDVLRSVSVIPESIVRSVYIRECSRIFNINESILYTETAKLRRNKLNSKDFSGYRPADPIPAIVQQQPVKIPERYNAEKEVVRLILQYGSTIIALKDKNGNPWEPKLTDFFINEIEMDELDFHHPVYSQIFSDIKRLNNEQNINIEHYFVTHPDNIISKTVVDLITSEYDLSKIWKKYETFFETEEMRLAEVAKEALLSFKNEKVIRLIKEAETELKHAQEKGDIERITTLQQKFKSLNSLRSSISKGLGDRIIIPAGD